MIEMYYIMGWVGSGFGLGFFAFGLDWVGFELGSGWVWVGFELGLG